MQDNPNKPIKIKPRPAERIKEKLRQTRNEKLIGARFDEESAMILRSRTRGYKF